MLIGSQKLLLSVLIVLLSWLIYFALADGRFQFFVVNSPVLDVVLSVVFSLYGLWETFLFICNGMAIEKDDIDDVIITGPISAIPSLIAKITKWANKNL